MQSSKRRQAAYLRLLGRPGVRTLNVTLFACRSQRLRRAVNRAMLTGARSGVPGTMLETCTPSALPSVPSDTTCSHRYLLLSLPIMSAIGMLFHCAGYAAQTENASVCVFDELPLSLLGHCSWYAA